MARQINRAETLANVSRDYVLQIKAQPSRSSLSLTSRAYERQRKTLQLSVFIGRVSCVYR